MRVVLDAGYNVDVRSELNAEAAGLPKVDRAAHEDAAYLGMLRAIVDGAAELALEKKPPVDRNPPGETGEGVARLAAGVDHAPNIDARPEKPTEPGVVGRARKRERRRQQFDRRVDRGAFVVNPVVGEDADPDLIDDVDISARKSERWWGDDRLRRRPGVDAQRGHVGRRRRLSTTRVLKERLAAPPPLQPRFRVPCNLNKGASGLTQAREASADGPVA